MHANKEIVSKEMGQIKLESEKANIRGLNNTAGKKLQPQKMLRPQTRKNTFEHFFYTHSGSVCALKGVAHLMYEESSPTDV